jgi:hypothetical protein
MFKIVLIVIAIVAIIATVVMRTGIAASGFPQLQPGQPDRVLGVIAVFLSVALLAVTFLVPGREGAAPSGKFYLSSLALVGLGWGLNEVQKARTYASRRRNK